MLLLSIFQQTHTHTHQERHRISLQGVNSNMTFKLTSGRFSQDNKKADQIAVASYDKTAVKIWILGSKQESNCKQKFGVLTTKTIEYGLFSFDRFCVPMDLVVAYLNNDEGQGTATLVVAYQKEVIGAIVTISIKSYQTKGTCTYAEGYVLGNIMLQVQR